jgi:ERCC4-related helicase
MAETETNREEELRRLLTDAIEVQLAALKAGISFWTEWIEQTSTFVTSASKTLSSINTEDPQAKDLLLELVDAGRASARAMTEIPRHTATRFLEELDRLDEKKKEAGKSAAKKATKRTGGSTAARKPAKSTRKARPKRAGRVKE